MSSSYLLKNNTENSENNYTSNTNELQTHISVESNLSNSSSSPLKTHEWSISDVITLTLVFFLAKMLVNGIEKGLDYLLHRSNNSKDLK